MVHKIEMLFFKASCTLCNLKTNKQYDTNGNYTVTTHELLYVTEALLNKVAYVHRFYAQTKLNYEMYALKF